MKQAQKQVQQVKDWIEGRQTHQSTEQRVMQYLCSMKQVLISELFLEKK